MITVLRIGHRISRDKRITTHVFLTARALGADQGVLSGEKDDKILASIRKTTSNWGGDFSVDYVRDWKQYVKEAKSDGFKIIHLTMYGMPVQAQMSKIKSNKVLIIVGSEKVAPEAYQLADFNIAVTNQPHSEVAALALFLDRYFKGRELNKKFNGKIQIIPSERGKEFK
jgi:tRNA (cytidine56-2'-O)-methyltransferase